jgi:hypothetical protein
MLCWGEAGVEGEGNATGAKKQNKKHKITVFLKGNMKITINDDY